MTPSRPRQTRGVSQSPSLPDADPRSDRPRCGGRESKFLAVALSYREGTEFKTPNLDRLAREGMRFTDAHSAESELRLMKIVTSRTQECLPDQSPTTMKHILPLLTILLFAPLAALHAADTAKPNILVILADDLGYGDVQCYNPQRGKIPTPNIDRLAAQGMRFTDGHSSSGVCSPSRYTLLTGRYHWRTRLQRGIVGVFGEPLIAPERMTIGTLAKQHGYRTATIGKWHLGWDWPITQEQRPLLSPSQLPADEAETPKKKAKKGGEVATEKQIAAWREVFSKPIANGPTTRGFDSYFGTDIPNWPPFCFIENDRTLGIPTEFLPASDFGNNRASNQGPALKDWKLENVLPALGNRAVSFITDSAKQPEPFLLYLPLTSPHTPLSVNTEWKGKSGLNLFADFVMETDAVVGRVLDALEKSGAAQNTLVLFTADNGCAPYIGAAELEAKGHFPSGPLRGYKADAWEGGHRVPFLARWPERIPEGKVSDEIICHVDLMATFAAMLREKLPANAGEDSYDIMPALLGKNLPKPIREATVLHSSKGALAIRQGDWVLIDAASGDGNHEPEWFKKEHGYQPNKFDGELYNLRDDRSQSKNLYGEKPQIAERLKKLLEKYKIEGRSAPVTRPTSGAGEKVLGEPQVYQRSATTN